MSDYIPKSTGTTYLRCQIARHKSMKRRMEKNGNKIKCSIISVPIETAIEIVENQKGNKESIISAIKVLEELEVLLDMGYESYSPTKLRSMCKRALVHVGKIK